MKMDPKYSEKYKEKDKHRARGWLTYTIFDNFPAAELMQIQDAYVYDDHDKNDKDEEGDEDYYVRKKEMNELVMDIINNDFTTQQREVFLMFHQFGITQVEIAKVLKTSQPHIAKCLRGCIKKIKGKLVKGEDLCQAIKRLNQERKRKLLIKSLKMKRMQQKQRLLKKQKRSHSVKRRLARFFHPLLRKK